MQPIYDKARPIRLAIFDVDGVLTDGSLYLTDGGEEIKAFNSLDGHGSRGRLRPLDPEALFPSWLDQGTQPKLSGFDGSPMDITITLVKRPRKGWTNDDHFAEFIVRQVTH